ncbi:hypothetical protein BCD48_38300 [Pseudofrankia sp. BMG5.36]|nr:hypothetical protein BCD48_38300 [Pseudofrankia sp. BMG5.36]
MPELPPSWSAGCRLERSRFSRQFYYAARITIQLHPATATGRSQAERIAAVDRLAEALGTTGHHAEPTRADRRGFAGCHEADGQLAGHPLHVFAHLTREPTP